MQQGPGQQPFGHDDAVVGFAFPDIVNAKVAPTMTKQTISAAKNTSNFVRIFVSEQMLSGY
jgi:hypothetical protein